MARSELEIAGGFFLVRVGQEEVRLPELPYGAAREWSRRLAAGLGPVFAAFEREWQPGDGLTPIELANEQAMDTLLDSVVAYDRTAALGGREAIADGMSASAIHRLYRTLYEEAHPFDADLSRTLLQMAAMRVNAAVQSGGASSTSPSSPDGASPQPTSTSDSPRASSSSSGSAATPASSARTGIAGAPSTSPSLMPSRGRMSRRASGRRGRAS